MPLPRRNAVKPLVSKRAVNSKLSLEEKRFAQAVPARVAVGYANSV